MSIPSLPSNIPLRLQDLSASAAHACLRICSFFNDELCISKPWPRCVAAVSGGADSSALLFVSHMLGIPLVVAHLDHQLRPSSGHEAEYVRQLAHALGIPFVAESVDIGAVASENGMGVEEAGRHARYAMLERVRESHVAEWIMLGHHLDDLAEDVMLRLVRGTGWPALAGMKARDDERRVLRPLLHTPRSELREILTLAGLSWCEDESNLERNTRRNRIRLDVMPLLEKENSGFTESIRKLWHLARIDEDYWNNATPRVNEQKSESIFLSRSILEVQHAAMRLRMYLGSIRKLVAFDGGQARVDALLQLDRIWQKGSTGKIIQLPGVRAEVTREGIVFSRGN